MVKLRSKLHLSRQRRNSSTSHASSLGECNATVPTRTAGSILPENRRDHSSSTIYNPILNGLPDKLLAKIASFCDFSDVVRLRHSCRALRLVFDKTSTLEEYLRRLVSMPQDPLPTAGGGPGKLVSASQRPRSTHAPTATQSFLTSRLNFDAADLEARYNMEPSAMLTS